MAIYVNDNGTLRQISFLAVNDNGTIRRVNEVYVNDGGSLAGPFSTIHQTSRNTETSRTTISGVQITAFNTTTTFDTDYSTLTTFDTSRTTTFGTDRTTTTTFNTTRSTDTTITTDHLTTTIFNTSTVVYERLTASQAGTLFDTEITSLEDYGFSFWDGSKWSENN